MVHRINPETPRQNPTTAIGVQTAGRYCQVARVIPAATMNVSMMCLKIISVGLARKGKSGGSGLQDAAKAKGLEESRPQRNSGNIAPRDKSRMALAADRVKLLLLEAYPRVLPPQNQRSNEREPGGIRTPHLRPSRGAMLPITPRAQSDSYSQVGLVTVLALTLNDTTLDCAPKSGKRHPARISIYPLSWTPSTSATSRSSRTSTMASRL